jgi:hypothetical protein
MFWFLHEKSTKTSNVHTLQNSIFAYIQESEELQDKTVLAQLIVTESHTTWKDIVHTVTNLV